MNPACGPDARCTWRQTQKRLADLLVTQGAKFCPGCGSPLPVFDQPVKRGCGRKG